MKFVITNHPERLEWHLYGYCYVCKKDMKVTNTTDEYKEFVCGGCYNYCAVPLLGLVMRKDYKGVFSRKKVPFKRERFGCLVGYQNHPLNLQHMLYVRRPISNGNLIVCSVRVSKQIYKEVYSDSTIRFMP